MEENAPSTELKPKEAFDIYENGKHRRYSLLFAVNGGAFAIAKLLTESNATGRVLGDLTLPHLSLGMAALTTVMVWDIYIFGERMRATYTKDAFGPHGKAVVLLLGGLLCAGWLLVGAGRVTGA